MHLTVISLLQAQRVDQDVLVGNRGGHALKFCQCPAAGQALQNGGRVKPGRVQGLQRLHGAKLLRTTGDMYRKQRFLYMVNATCIENLIFHTNHCADQSRSCSVFAGCSAATYPASSAAISAMRGTLCARAAGRSCISEKVSFQVMAQLVDKLGAQAMGQAKVHDTLNEFFKAGEKKCCRHSTVI